LKKFKADLYISGMNGERALIRLRRGGIPVLRAQKKAKNLLVARIYRKDVKKTFTILADSCYNINKVVPVGAYYAVSLAVKRISFIACALAFIAAIAASDGLILSVSYFGGGAYYKGEAEKILSERGIGAFKFLSGADIPLATTQILSLPNVSFCSIKREGYILKVKIEVSSSTESAISGGLYCDRAGVVKSVVVLSGTASVKEGDMVSAGDELVSPYNIGAGGEKRECIASARVEVECSATAEGLSEEDAKNRAMFECDGEISNVFVEGGGEVFKAVAVYIKTFSINM